MLISKENNALYSFYCRSFRAFDEAAVYSEVFNQTNMKYEMSKVQTSIPPGYEDHNGEDVSANQCHAHILRPVSG